MLPKREDVAPSASPDAHSRRIFVALPAGSQSSSVVYAAFLRSLLRMGRQKLEMADVKRVRGRSIFGTLTNPTKLGSSDQAASTVYSVIALPAPTRVSPAPATEQEQHHKNNQYGFHSYNLTLGEAGLAFVAVISFSSLRQMI